MQSTKPYLIRAIHEWCVDHGLTPYISVAVDATTRVPREFVKNNQIVLNVGLEATNQLHLGNEEITFQGRFGGKVFPVVVPIARVAAIYARENNEGMAFEVTTTSSEPLGESVTHVDAADGTGEETSISPEPVSGQSTHERPAGRPALTRVK